MIKNCERGFTLVELLIVIAIMSILTVITASQFTSAQRKAKDVQRKGDLSSLSKALQMYYADYGVFPENINGYFDSEKWGAEFKDINEEYVYMKVLPRESRLEETSPYCYVVSGDRKAFGLFAMLENTSDGECKLDEGGHGLYSHCNNASAYCYSIVSPNTTVDGLSD